MFDNDFGFETILVEVRLHRGKWLIGACYNPHKRNIDCFLKKNYQLYLPRIVPTMKTSSFWTTSNLK